MERAYEAGSSMVGGGDVELMEKAKHKGRAYQCLACHYKEGRVVIDVKGRVEDHILKNHVRLDEVPFYCSLCLFRCHNLEQLNRHVTAYARHVEMAKKRNVRDHQPYLMRSSNPYKIGSLDCMQLSAEESRRHFVQQAKLRRGRDDRNNITQAMQQIYSGDFPAEFEDLIRMVEASPIAENADPGAVNQTTSPLLVAEKMVPCNTPFRPCNTLLQQPMRVPGRMSLEPSFQPVPANHAQVQDASQTCFARPARGSQVVPSFQAALGKRSEVQVEQGVVPVYSRPVILSQTPEVYSTSGTSVTAQRTQLYQMPMVPATQSPAGIDVHWQDAIQTTHLSPITQRMSTYQGVNQMSTAHSISLPSPVPQPARRPDVRDGFNIPMVATDLRIVQDKSAQATLEPTSMSTPQQLVTVPTPPSGCPIRPVAEAHLGVSSSTLPTSNASVSKIDSELSLGSLSSLAEPEDTEQGEAEDPLTPDIEDAAALDLAPQSRTDRMEEKSDTANEENIMPQLLPEEAMELTTPKKRQQTEDEGTEPRTKQRRIATAEPSFNISQVALNGLVEAIQGLREEVSRSVRTSERVEKALNENNTIMSKVTDALTRLKNAIEGSDKEERRREYRQMEAERRREEERRREREEDRKREDRRREFERKEREERRFEQDRKEREQRKQGKDKRPKVDGKKESREKENEPRVKSVLGRSYTENLISDRGRKH